MTTEEKAKRYDEALERAKKQLEEAKVFDYEEGQIAHDIRTTTYAIFPELSESEDERIRKELIAFLKENHETGRAEETWSLSGIERWIAWLEKQKVITEGDFGRGYDCGYQAGYAVAMNEMEPKVAMATLDSEKQKDSVSNAKYIEDVAHAFEDGRKKGIEEKQKEQKPTEWSEEDGKEFNDTLYDGFNAFEDGFNKGYELGKHDLAMEFLNYLDKNCPEGKMCVSNGECEDIDKAFKENDWAKIIRYAKKYQIQSEQKPEVKLTGWVARDRNGEIYVYGDYPEKDSERPIWIGSNSINLYQESFPNLKWEDEPMEVEITIRKNNTL